MKLPSQWVGQVTYNLLRQAVEPGPWITPVLGAAWVVANARPVEYRIMGDGSVKMRGEAHNTNGAVAFETTPIFTMPPSLAPLVYTGFPTAGFAGTTFITPGAKVAYWAEAAINSVTISLCDIHFFPGKL